MVFGSDFTKALIGDQADMSGCGEFNSIIFACVRLRSDGTPQLDSESFWEQYARYFEEDRGVLDKFALPDWESTFAKINARFKTVRLEPTEAIVGTVNYNVGGRRDALVRLSQSDTAKLAYGDQVVPLAAWLVDAYAQSLR
jgi:hypothetical protein